MVDVLRKEFAMGFDEAVERVERIVKEEGFSVLLTKSIDEIMKKKLGLADYPRYTIILGCAPELARKSLIFSLSLNRLIMVFIASLLLLNLPSSTHRSISSIIFWGSLNWT